MSMKDFYEDHKRAIWITASCLAGAVVGIALGKAIESSLPTTVLESTSSIDLDVPDIPADLGMTVNDFWVDPATRHPMASISLNSQGDLLKAADWLSKELPISDRGAMWALLEWQEPADYIFE